MRIVITGAGGIVGSGLRPHMRKKHELVLIARSDPADPVKGETWVRADINDAAAMATAMQGADAVLHLAAAHGYDISFAQTLDTNYQGTINVYEAAIAAGVKHLFFASTNHGWGFCKASQAPFDETAQPAADGWYGISKLWGEAVTGYYAEAHGLCAASLRIGHMNDHVPSVRQGRMWISYRDFASLLDVLIDTTKPGHKVLWATADCADPLFDNAAIKQLGWFPKDAPIDHTPADVIQNNPAPDDDIGGPFALANRKVRP